MIRNILFDNDGVLVDTEHVFYEANCEMLAEYGIDLPEKEFAALSMTQGLSLADIIVKLAGVSPEEAEEARQRRNVRYDAMLRDRELVIDGVRETLAALHGRFRIGVVTCCQTMHFRTIHSRSGLLPFFDFVVGDDDFIHHKPHPEPYLTALKKYDLKPEETIAVEDSQRGVMSAQSAGLKCAAIPRGLSLYGDLSFADWQFENITDFAGMLLNGNTHGAQD